MVMTKASKDIMSNIQNITNNCIESIKNEFKEVNIIILNDVKS